MAGGGAGVTVFHLELTAFRNRDGEPRIVLRERGETKACDGLFKAADEVIERRTCHFDRVDPVTPHRGRAARVGKARRR